MLGEGKIGSADLALLVVTDSPSEVERIVRACYEEQCWKAARASVVAASRLKPGLRNDRRLPRTPPGPVGSG